MARVSDCRAIAAERDGDPPQTQLKPDMAEISRDLPRKGGGSCTPAQIQNLADRHPERIACDPSGQTCSSLVAPPQFVDVHQETTSNETRPMPARLEDTSHSGL